MKSAVVVGGGIAGLATAKVLSRHYETVTVYDGGPQAQAQHLHVLLKRGQELLEGLFPGILNKMKHAGCPEIDWALDTEWENNTGIFPRYKSSVKTLSMSRVLIQDLMRAGLTELFNVEFKQERLESIKDVSADLLVIAAGQNFSLKECIQTEEILPINLTYRSFVFNQCDLNLGHCKQYYYQVDPPHSLMGGVLCPIEGGKMMMTLIESEKTFTACSSFEDFMALAKRIPGDKFSSIIGDAKPLTSLSVFRKATTHRRKLDVSKIPPNTAILGDVLTSLNPVFGQGMTLSLMQVHRLDRMLKDGFNSSTFHKDIHRLGLIPYSLSKLGSQEMGVGKSVLRGYLRACQNAPLLHHQFLKRLHHP